MINDMFFQYKYTYTHYIFARTLGNLTMVFTRTVGNLTKIFSKSQIPGGSPGGGMIAVGTDWYIIPISRLTEIILYRPTNQIMGKHLFRFLVNLNFSIKAEHVTKTWYLWYNILPAAYNQWQKVFGQWYNIYISPHFQILLSIEHYPSLPHPEQCWVAGKEHFAQVFPHTTSNGVQGVDYVVNVTLFCCFVQNVLSLIVVSWYEKYLKTKITIKYTP